MSAETEAVLRRINDEDVYPPDAMHVHMKSLGHWDWCDVAADGCDAYRIMTGIEVEEDSPLSALLDGVAAQAQYGALHAVAAALGVSQMALLFAVEEWLDSQHKGPPIGADALMRRIAEEQVYLDATEQAKAAGG